ncbi:MAG: periplasmic heavy metal sensor [Sideroxydans sp.]|nr:periplasmic heavy metal sensor [Sideroxydans sp.]
MKNTAKLAFLCAVGLTMGAAASTASAADTSSKAAPQKPAVSKPAGHSGVRGAQDHCEYGPGMMGGGGYGRGMMGGGMMESPRMGMIHMLDLSDEQRAKINKLSDQLQHDNWATMGAMMDETAKLRDLYEADKRDPAAIGNEYQKIFDLKRQMIVAMLTTQNKIEDLLTDAQRAQLKGMRQQMGQMYGHPMMR